MAIDFEVVLYQIVIVLFPVFIYQLFFNEKKRDRLKPHSKLTIITLLTLLLSMSFPIQFSDGYVYDFRTIPFLISFLYGGPIPGIIITIALLCFRWVIGGNGFYVVLLNYSLTCVFLLFTCQKYAQLHLKHKIWFVSLFFTANTFIIMTTFFTTHQTKQIPFMLAFYIITWACLMIVILVIEKINHQIRIREQLHRDERLNVISQLAASVAHEVRNPLTSVRGFLQLLGSDQNLHDSQKNYIEIALNELNHAQSIIDDYLSLARPNTEVFSLINISEEVQKTVALMSSYSNIQSMTIQSTIQDSLFIKGNKGEIKQVLVNIIKNGIEAMDSGGLLCIDAYEKNALVVIEISDSGKGMAPGQIKKLGTPFYTTKEKGTGVGLTLSFQIIQSMKGKVNVTSQLGKGTTFTLQFPCMSPLADVAN